MEERQINAEIKRLTKIFSNIDKDKKDLCEQLVQNAAFMAVSLRELQEQIKKSEEQRIALRKNIYGR